MKRVGDLIPAIFNEKFLEKTRGYSAFFNCWEDLMVKNGIAAAAGHSWIKNVEKGLVWIEVDHPGWKQILQTKESKLLHDFRYRFPNMGISGISIVLCKTGTNEVKSEKVKVKSEEGGESGAAISATETCSDKYSEIKDEALKQILARLEKHIAEREGHSSS